MRLKDKIIIVTGAGHGLGLAYATRFATEGARVCIEEFDEPAGARAAEAIRMSGGSAWFRHTDVTKFDQVQALVEDTVKRHGRVDVLLNNAGIYETQKVWTGPIEELDEREWDRVMDVNLKGVFFCCKAAIPHMKKQKAGKIINVASATFFLGVGDMPHYTTSKGGVVAMTRVMAKQLGAWNINVNCLTPGSTMTEEKITDEVRGRRQRAAAGRAFPRIETAEDVTGTALFLASADSDYMTGQLLVVEGGGVMH
jgi:3-oxoacyl-[acyl-carrier protein] reductase